MATYGTFVDNVALTAAELNDFFVWNSFVPQIFQPSSISISSTLRFGKYAQVNKVVIGSAYFRTTGSGTALNVAGFALPVTAASNSEKVIGCGYLQTSSGYDRFSLIRVSTTRASFVLDNSVATTGYDTAVANGCDYTMNFVYKAA